MTWLGYPNTTGLAAIDYRLVDAITDPVGEADGWATEQLIRLPDGFLCLSRPIDAPPVAAPPVLGRGRITFGSFNKLAKISDQVIELWSEILHRVPGSALLMKDRGFDYAAAQRRFLAAFQRHGIGPDRLAFLGTTEKTSLHYYDLVDVALDSFPYNGTITSCEALWMGVPVVTLLGDRHAARVGASLLTHAGFSEWIAPNPAAYAAIAVDLASDPRTLADCRARQRGRLAAARLCDGPRFMRGLEAVYRNVWEKRWAT
jgi:predicted O-linked N-acetylglucosamine transferase (SPINDLY family)